MRDERNPRDLCNGQKDLFLRADEPDPLTGRLVEAKKSLQHVTVCWTAGPVSRGSQCLSQTSYAASNSSFRLPVGRTGRESRRKRLTTDSRRPWSDHLRTPWSNDTQAATEHSLAAPERTSGAALFRGAILVVAPQRREGDHRILPRARRKALLAAWGAPRP